MLRLPISPEQRAEIESLSAELQNLQARYATYLSAIQHGAGHTAPLSFQGLARRKGGWVAVFAKP